MIHNISKRLSGLTIRQKIQVALLTFLVGSFIISVIYDFFTGKGPFGINISETMALYENSDPAFVIQYPKNWGAFDTPQGNHGDLEVVAVIGTPTPTFSPGLQVAFRLFPQGTLDDVRLWGQMRASRQRDYIPGESIGHDTSNGTGILFDYSWKDWTLFRTNVNVRCFDWYTLDGTSGYALSFCAEPNQWPKVETVFNKMLESFSTR